MIQSTDYSENTALFREYRNGSRAALEKLTKDNMKLVISIARRFTSRGYELEDLIQTGVMGLLKALNGFDESRGFSFSTYAFPFIAGEIKRFLRDDGPIKVSRSAKANASKVTNARESFIKKHFREPKISELCELTGLSYEEISQAFDISRPTLSLQDRLSSDGSDTTIEDTVSGEDNIEAITFKIALRQEIETLSCQEKQIIHLRFFKNLTQTQTASLLGISQVTVSRAEKRIIDKLRQKIL